MVVLHTGMLPAVSPSGVLLPIARSLLCLAVLMLATPRLARGCVILVHRNTQWQWNARDRGGARPRRVTGGRLLPHPT
jgi:hypothetical protein